jgi:hypothetical protein
MRIRRTWILLACALLTGLVLAVGAHGCGPAIDPECPYLISGIYSPYCCKLFGQGCAVPCVAPAGQVESCRTQFCEECKRPNPDDSTLDCTDWYKTWCTQDGGTDAGTDTAITDGATGCAGDCVPAPPAGWDGPLLLGLGPDGTALACPSNAPVVAYQGHADLVATPASCTDCTCSAPSGTCMLPSLITASALSCVANGPASRTFDPPPAWDGSCTAFDPVAAGDLCNGALCADSLTSGPVVLTENGCEPSTVALMNVDSPTWDTAALGCLGVYPASACDDLALACAPSAAQAPGFLSCIFQHGDNTCPVTYPDKHLVYVGFDDHRGCAPCACGAPKGSCAATLDVFKDDTCTKPVLLKLDLTPAGPTCSDLPAAGLPLGSKQLALSYDPGGCAPGGGEPVGAVDPSDPSTFCCLASA